MVARETRKEGGWWKVMGNRKSDGKVVVEGRVEEAVGGGRFGMD